MDTFEQVSWRLPFLFTYVTCDDKINISIVNIPKPNFFSLGLKTLNQSNKNNINISYNSTICAYIIYDHTINILTCVYCIKI